MDCLPSYPYNVDGISKITFSSTDFLSAVNPDPKLDIFTDVFIFGKQVVGVYPTTEINTLI